MNVKEQVLESKTTSNEVSKHNRTQLIVFKLGKEDYGLSIDQIKEVVLTPNITKMPLHLFC